MANNNNAPQNVDDIPELATEVVEDLDSPITEEELGEILNAEEAASEKVEGQKGKRASRRRGAAQGQTRKVEEETPPEPALTAKPRRNSHERKQDADDYIAARNQRQEDAMTVAKYISAERQKTVLSGKIAGVELRGPNAFWVIYDGPVIVMIPFMDALPFLSNEALVAIDAGSENLVRQRQLLTKSVGATVQFSVEQIVPDNENNVYLVYGSRKVAMERIRNRYFGANASVPVREGDDVTGTFLAIGPHAAWVNVRGVDVRLIPHQLSHRYMEDMTEVFKPGDEITLRVQKLEMRDNGPYMVLSALPCELEECKTRLGRIRQGNRYIATMTAHRLMNAKNPRTQQVEPYYVASMWLEDVNVAAFATMTSSHAKGTAHSGDRVVVEVEQIALNGYVRCRIISYLHH